MSSLTRMLAVFDVFTPEEPSLSADTIMARLNYTRGTGYRYIRELTAAGFLVRNAGQYSFGPRIIELDYFIRKNDPRLQIIQPLMRAISDRLECDVLWTNFFGASVVVAHHEKGNMPLTVSYGRGRRMPLFRGAGSKVILAALPSAHLKRIYLNGASEIAAAGLGNSWKEFRAQLAAIRRAGFAISRRELELGNVGVAAPIASDPQNPPGSLILVFSEKRHETADEDKIVRIVKEAAEQISGLFTNISNPTIATEMLTKKPA